MSSKNANVAASTIYLGLDVHKDSITIAVLPEQARAPERVERLPNDLAKVRRWFSRMAQRGAVRACYEASGAGYVLHRALREWATAAT
jgi:negative regulator of sigma E activity